MGEDAETVVGMAKNYFDEAVVNSHNYATTYVKVANSKIDSVVEIHDNSASLFVSSKKRLFFTNIERLDKDYIARRIDAVRSAIKFIEPKEDYFGIAKGAFKYPRLGYDKRIANYGNETAIEIAEEAIGGAESAGAEKIAGMISLGYSDSELATSNGIAMRSGSSSVRISLRAFKGSIPFQNIVASRYLSKLNPRKFGSEVGRFPSTVSEKKKIGGGAYDIIYMPQPAGLLLENVNAMACIGSIETGSFLANRIGKKIANDALSIYDDGATREGVNSSPYDAEGYPTQRTPVIKDGMLKNYLHNFSTAKKYKTRSTGNAGLVMPSPNTAVVEHKNLFKSLDEIIGNTKRGILVTNTWYTRFSNYLTGDFSTVPRDMALYIESGEPKFAIGSADSSFVGIRISDNMLRMLKNITAAAGKTVQTSSWDAGSDYYFTPSILVENVKVTTA